MENFFVTAFYNFTDFSDAEFKQLEEDSPLYGEQYELCGLIIIAKEGINATVAGPEEKVLEFEDRIRSLPGCSETVFKHSYCNFKPFRRFKVKARDEIVTLNRPDIRPFPNTPSHLPPEEWQKVLESDEDYVLIDTRNWYETDLGKFTGALTPPLDKFSDFGDFVRESGIPKDKKVLMYCTGGIRCEKASIEMQQMGYENVFQLEGGILRYLEEFPNKNYEGECFVFDHRVAVNQELQASEKYGLCPHCGNPGDEKINCKRCEQPGYVCKKCAVEEKKKTCSKDCAYQYQRQLEQSMR